MRKLMVLAASLVFTAIGSRPADHPRVAAPISVKSPFNVGISVTDVEKSARWYEENLGLVRLKSGTFPAGKFVILASREMSVEIIQHESAVDPRKKLSIAHDYLVQGIFKFGFYVDDLDATVACLKQKHVKFYYEHGEDKELQLRFAIVADDDGNTIQLFEPSPGSHASSETSR